MSEENRARRDIFALLSIYSADFFEDRVSPTIENKFESMDRRATLPFPLLVLENIYLVSYFVFRMVTSRERFPKTTAVIRTERQL
jgi:hypothetical protein